MMLFKRAKVGCGAADCASEMFLLADDVLEESVLVRDALYVPGEVADEAVEQGRDLVGGVVGGSFGKFEQALPRGLHRAL